MFEMTGRESDAEPVPVERPVVSAATTEGKSGAWMGNKNVGLNLVFTKRSRRRLVRGWTGGNGDIPIG